MRRRSGGTKATVLLAEDNPVNRLLARRLLERRGHVVRCASTGREALGLLEQECYDVAILDVQMPELDGFEVTATVRQREAREGGHLRIVAMTANAMHGDRERCLAAGMDGYVPKPVVTADLYAAVEAGARPRHGGGSPA